VNREKGFLAEALQIHMCTDLGVCPVTVPSLPRHSGKRSRRATARRIIERKITFEAFTYGFSPETITVQRGDRVKLLVTSRDVPHCIVIKEFGVQVPVRKGVPVTVEFTPDRTGEFTIRCSFACRNRHAGSTARLIVEE
jgi:heme/copper-type cytochrome/quinol oxidase subunit 2